MKSKKPKKKWLNKNDYFILNVSWQQTAWPGNYLQVDLGNYYYIHDIMGGYNSASRLFEFRFLDKTVSEMPGASLNYGAGCAPFVQPWTYSASQTVTADLPSPILTRGFLVGCTALVQVQLIFFLRYAMV